MDARLDYLAGKPVARVFYRLIGPTAWSFRDGQLEGRLEAVLLELGNGENTRVGWADGITLDHQVGREAFDAYETWELMDVTYASGWTPRLGQPIARTGLCGPKALVLDFPSGHRIAVAGGRYDAASGELQPGKELVVIHDRAFMARQGLSL